MVLTPSTMLALGTPAPDFRLPEVVSGKMFTLADFKDKSALLVMFICRHCPYVKHVEQELVRLGKDYVGSTLGIIAISSNDAGTYPDDAPASLKEMALSLGFAFAFCYDGDQKIARDYTAACTPDFFLFDTGRRLIYRGQLDDSRPGNGKPVTGKDLRGAIAATLADRPIAGPQRPSIGCNIKWKKGQEPAYFGST